MTKACFICASPDVLPDHRVCAEHHVPALCHTCRHITPRKYTKPTTKTSPHTTVAFDALAMLGGRATSKEIAAETGLTGNQVRAGLDAAPNVRYERPGKALGIWIMEHAA